MRRCELAIVRDEVNPRAPGRNRIVGHICRIDHWADRIEDGKLRMARWELTSMCHIVELPNGVLELHGLDRFSKLRAGPYYELHQIQREVERYDACEGCQIVDLVVVK